MRSWKVKRAFLALQSDTRQLSMVRDHYRLWERHGRIDAQAVDLISQELKRRACAKFGRKVY